MNLIVTLPHMAQQQIAFLSGISDDRSPGSDSEQPKSVEEKRTVRHPNGVIVG